MTDTLAGTVPAVPARRMCAGTGEQPAAHAGLAPCASSACAVASCALQRAAARAAAALLLALALALCGAAMLAPAAKAAPAIDTSAECSLTVSPRAGSAMAGAQALLYRVASIDAAGNLALTSTFSAYAAELSLAESHRASDAALLAEKVRDARIAASASALLGSSGSASFGGLTPGLYLLRIPDYESGGHSYATAPALIQLPQLAAGSWRYSVTAEPKSDVDPGTPVDPEEPADPTPDEPAEPAPDEPADPAPDEPTSNGKDNNPGGSRPNHIDETGDGEGGEDEGGKLPQTGMLLWPVPVLLTGGLALILAGLIRRSRARD